MRIVYLVMQWPKDSEAFIATDIRALTADGHRISIKAFRGPPSDATEVLASRRVHGSPISNPSIQDGLLVVRRWTEVIRVLSMILHIRPRRWSHMLRAAALVPRAVAIAAEVRRERPDVVHAFWGHYPAVALLAIAGTGGVRPVLTTSLLAYDLEMRFSPGVYVARSIADRVFTHAEVNRSALRGQGIPAGRIDVIRAGVDPEWLLPDHAKADSSDTFNILTVGRLMESKGHGDVVRAFCKIVEAGHESATLSILGSGPYRSALAGMIEAGGVAGRAELAGHVPHDLVKAAMRRADVFVLMSWYSGERLPNVVKEAMSCGCVCIVARSTGIDELVHDGVTGWILEPRDWQGLFRRLEALAADPVLRRRMGEAGRRLIDAEYNARTQQRRYVDAWSSPGRMHPA